MITDYSISGQEYIPIMADYLHSATDESNCIMAEKVTTGKV
jgi:hypothetical protein